MTTLDLGPALSERGRCQSCREGHRPIWLDGDPIERALCATCVVKAHLGMLVTFHAGVRADASRLLAVREDARQGNGRVRIGSDEVLDADYYEAEVIDYTDETEDGQPLMSRPFNPEDDPKPQWLFTFELLEVEGRKLSAWINKPADEDNVSPRAKLVQLANACLPGLEPGEDWTVGDLLHKQLRLNVDVYEKTDGTKRNKVTGFKALKDAEPARRQPVAVERTVARVSNGAGGDLATPAQVRAIYLIGRDQHSMSDSDVDERSVELYGLRPAELSKKQASGLITALKAGAQEPVPTVAQRRAAAAVADPWVDEDDVPF